MAGGRRIRGVLTKSKFEGSQSAKPVSAEKSGSDSNLSNEHALGGDRKRDRETDSSPGESRGPLKKRRATITPSVKQESVAVKSTSRQSEDAEAILKHDAVTETRLPDPDPSSLPEDHEVEQSYPGLVPGATLGSETPLTEDLNTPHSDVWISFGHLELLGDPSVCFNLEIMNNGSESRDFMMGSDPSCDFLVEGDGIALDVRKEDTTAGSTLSLASEMTDRSAAELCPPTLRTTVWAGGRAFAVEEKMLLSTGNVIRLGEGASYVYHGPKLTSLYAKEPEASVYDHKGPNSSVTQVHRLCDKSDFVAKEIPHSKIEMARTEILVYEVLGPHPSILRFIESFYDFESGIHHLILEAGFMDLHDFTLDMRPTGQDVLHTYAAKWTRQITEGIEHMHKHGITHRDIKPKNILVCLGESDRVDMKIMDMGLANQNTTPLTEEVSSQFSKTQLPAELMVAQWLAGTPGWYAPGSFMAYRDDKYVDCYAIGRILFFLSVLRRAIILLRILIHLFLKFLDSRRTSGLRRPENRAELAIVKKNVRWNASRGKPLFGSWRKQEQEQDVGRITGLVEPLLKPYESGLILGLDFMKKLLVAYPTDCSTTSELLKHPYLIMGNWGPKLVQDDPSSP
ncbi:hypothetical protein FS837_007935 [Tulasnella sp. UAMH 9824]|nr:hypothetical protein FS837_007935 [Tulasnella sp. UAMH 9824]